MTSFTDTLEKECIPGKWETALTDIGKYCN